MNKLRIRSRAESIRKDPSKEDGDLTFSEQSRRIIYGTSKVELFALGKTTATCQCQSFFEHMLEGMCFCECGYCPHQNEDIINKIKARFKTLIAPNYLPRMKSSRGEKAWRATLARRSLESQGCYQKCGKNIIALSFGQMAEQRNLGKFPSGNRME